MGLGWGEEMGPAPGSGLGQRRKAGTGSASGVARSRCWGAFHAISWKAEGLCLSSSTGHTTILF